MRVTISLCLAAMLLVQLGCGHAEDTDDSLRVYAVNIIRHPTESWTGKGIYLGKGLIITVAHVVGWASRTNPSVQIAGLDLPAKAIKQGSYLWGVDLTLLSVDEEKLPMSLRMRRMPLCETPPWPGEPLIVAVAEGTARSRIMSPRLLPQNVRRRFSTVISDVATTGNSGSGVFDAGRKCLLGIMSRKISVRSNSADAASEEKDIAKYISYQPQRPAPSSQPTIPYRELACAPKTYQPPVGALSPQPHLRPGRSTRKPPTVEAARWTIDD